MSTPPRRWDEPARTKVKALLRKGMSCGAVAKVMRVSRNAAIGRIYRDEELVVLVHRRPIATAASCIPKLKIKRPAPDRRFCSAGPDFDRKPLSGSDEAPDPEQAMPIVDTGRTRCKWPMKYDKAILGHFLCCGGQTEHNDVYCPYHRNKARQVQ